MPESGPASTPLRSPRVLAGLAGLLLAAAIAVVLVAVLHSTHRRSAGLPALSQRQSLETVFSTGSTLFTDPSREIAQIHALGVDVVRVTFAWDSIAPDPSARHAPAGFRATDPNAYPAGGWAIYDEIARDLAADHMRMDLVLANPAPDWAFGPGAPAAAYQLAYNWDPDARMFEQFVQAVGTRYSGHFTPPGQSSPLPRETFWSLWNEPNAGVMLAPQTIDHNTVESSPYHYRLLADAAWTGLQRTGHGHDTMLLGELAPVGTSGSIFPGMFAVMTPLRFLDALYCVDASLRPLRGSAAALRHCPTTAAASRRFAAQNPVLFKATDFAVHPYPQALPPDQTVPGAPQDFVLANLPRMFSTLDTVQRLYGSSTRFDAYSTEYGYITSPPGTQSGSISPVQAAHWLNWSEYLSWRMPRVVSYDQYLMDDPPPVAGKPYTGFASGLRRSSGARKPGWFAFRMPIWLPQTHAAHGAQLEVWGCVRPAKLYPAGRRGPAQIQFRAAGAGAWRTIATVSVRTAQGYFDVDERFPSSGDVRIRWAPPAGAAMESLVTAITVG